MELTKGIHILGTVFTAKDFCPQSADWYHSTMLDIIWRHGLTVMTDGFADFDGGGFTGFIALAESHVSIHTWFELGFVHLDAFVCNVTRDNRDICRQTFQAIAQLFQPVRIELQEILR